MTVIHDKLNAWRCTGCGALIVRMPSWEPASHFRVPRIEAKDGAGQVVAMPGRLSVVVVCREPLCLVDDPAIIATWLLGGDPAVEAMAEERWTARWKAVIPSRADGKSKGS